MSTVPFSQSRRYPLPADTAKKLPHNLDAEKSVLGAVLMDNKALRVAAEKVNAADFFTPRNTALSANGRIFMAMLRMAEEEKPIDLVTLTVHLSADTELAAYISSLADGMPRVSNVAHYAEIVREKSLLRQIIHKTDQIQQRALNEEHIGSQELITDVELFTREAASPGKLTHTPVDALDLLTMEMPEREHMFEPILPVKGIAEVYAWRGSGKTFVMMEMAECLAAGLPTCFVWNVPKARPVLYVDGEMNREDLQERQRSIARGHDMRVPERGMLRFIAADLEEKTPPQIITAEGRRRIEDHLRGGELLVLDNLSSLQSTGTERETEEWAVTQDWLLGLRRRGFTSIFLHHAGKDGKQRGTSNREDVVNLVISLRRPADYSQEDGLRCEVFLEKVRGRVTGIAAQPFELKLETDHESRAVWLRRPLKQIILKRAHEMLAAGMNAREIAEDLHLTRYQVYRIKQKFNADPMAPTEE